MTEQALTDLLAERVMGWRMAPDRYLKIGRNWIPKWRFAPLVRLEDAFQLLDQFACSYKLERVGKHNFAAEVCFEGRTGKASGDPKTRTITLAIARALRLEEPNAL